MKPHRPLSALLLTLLAGAALAQQPAPSREREMLRRSQAALQEAAAQRDAAVAEKAAVQKERDAARDEAGKARAAAARTLGAERQRAQADLEAVRAELVQLRQQMQAQAEAAAAQEQKSAQAAAALRRELAERTLANVQLVALLEKSTGALAASEQRNRELHALGLELVERWRSKGADEQRLQAEPVLGLRAVRIEDEAEALRTRLHALRAPVR
jgi:hypothetical protein